MASSKNPLKIADVPERIQLAAARDKRIHLNLRPDNWPPELIQEFKNDRQWQIRMSLGEGFLVAPSLTRVLESLSPGQTVLLSCQGARGEIFTLVNTFKEVYWLDSSIGRQGCKDRRGVLAQIRLTKPNRFGAEIGNVWGSYVLALAKINRARHTSRSDSDGAFFLSILKRSGGKKRSQRDEVQLLNAEYKVYIGELKTNWLAENRLKSLTPYEVMSLQEREQVHQIIFRWRSYITPLAEAWWRQRGYGVTWPKDDSKPMKVRRLKKRT